MEINERLQREIGYVKSAVKNGIGTSGMGCGGSVTITGPEGIYQSIKVREMLEDDGTHRYFITHCAEDEDGNEVTPPDQHMNIACYGASIALVDPLGIGIFKRNRYSLSEYLGKDPEFNVTCKNVDEANRVLRTRAINLAETVARETELPVDRSSIR